MKWLRHGWISAALAITLFAVSVTFGFAYDDVHIIQNRPLLHSLGNWQEILTAPWWIDALYRPLTMLTFAMDWAVGGGAPWVFHLVNVLLHAAVTYGVWLLARPAGVVTALVAAGLFAVHPVHVEAVANIVGRAELLATLAALGAVLAVRWNGSVARLATLGFLIVGLAAKETAFAIPGLLLITIWLSARVVGLPFGTHVRRHAGLVAIAVLLTGTWIAMRAGILGDVAGDHPAPGLEGLGLGARVIGMSPVIVQWVRLLVWPAALSVDYSPDHFSVATGMTLAGLAGFAVLAAATWWGWRERARDPWITYGLLWMGGTLLVISNVLVPSGVLLAERSLYLPSVGAMLVLGRLAERALAAVPAARVRTVWAVIGVVVALGAARSALRVPAWRDTNTTLTQLLTDAPRSFRAWWVAGISVWMDGDPVLGEDHFRNAIHVYPLWKGVWLDYGRLLERDGQWSRSAWAYAVAFELDSSDAHAAANAIVNYVRAGVADSARMLADKAHRLQRSDYRVQIALSDLALAEGRPLEALTWRRQVAWRFPQVWQYWFLAAQAAHEAERCDEYRALAERVRALAPDRVMDPAC